MLPDPPKPASPTPQRLNIVLSTARRLSPPAEVARLELLIRSLESDLQALNDEARDLIERRAADGV